MRELKREKKCIGIDLGTTNTTVAVSSLDTNDKIVLEDIGILQRSDGRNGSNLILPSIFYYDGTASKRCVGYQAQHNKKLDYRKNDLTETHYIENSKRYIGTPTKWKIGSKQFTAVDVAADILDFVVNKSRIKKILDDSDIFITVPANFNTDQRNDTLRAAQKAGIKNVELFDEPKAAILSYIHSEIYKRPEDKSLDIGQRKRILVIDIGGGTCDICLQDVWSEGEAFMFEPLGTPNRENIGGMDFDQRIAEYLRNKHLKGVELTAQQKLQILDVGQLAKERISDDITYFIADEFEQNEEELYSDPKWREQLAKVENWGISSIIGGKNIEFELTAREFIEIIAPLIEDKGIIAQNKDQHDQYKNIARLIKNTLKESEIYLDTVDIMFLTGGMANCFVLKAILHDIFAIKIISPAEPFHVVSRGAALINKYPMIESAAKDKMSYSIMLEMQDGCLKTLIEAGDSVPVENCAVVYSFKTVSRNGVTIGLYEGKNEYDCQLRKIHTIYSIEFETPQNIGREFKIKYSIDKTKRIAFEIEFTDNGEKHFLNAVAKEES